MYAATLLMALATIGQPKANWEKVQIVSVMSTDTVVVKTQTDPMLWVALLGVGTPESVDSRKDGFLYGLPDPRWLDRWLPPGTPAWMERRGETVTGRPLVFLYRIDGFCWNAFLVKTGGAYACRQIDFPEFRKLESYEALAKERRLGLWKGYEVKAETASSETVASTSVESNSPRSATSSTSRPASRAQTVFSPPNYIGPGRKRRHYANQDAARAQLDMMMGQMMGQGFRGYSGYSGSSFGTTNGPWNGYTVHVRDYVRQDGTFVQSHYRRPPGTAQ